MSGGKQGGQDVDSAVERALDLGRRLRSDLDPIVASPLPKQLRELVEKLAEVTGTSPKNRR